MRIFNYIFGIASSIIVLLAGFIEEPAHYSA